MYRSVKDAWSCLSDIHHNLKKSMKITTKAVEEGQASTTALNILAMEKIGVFYAAVTIFFRAVWQYCKIVNRTDEQGKPTLWQTLQGYIESKIFGHHYSVLLLRAANLNLTSHLHFCLK
jgi:hypothetical protein